MSKYERLKQLIVLYVEDEKDVMDEVVEMLELKVKKLYTANNGQEGLKSFTENDIDIIITDIKMPIMDGLEMIEQIRKFNGFIPIIIITTAFNETSFFKKAIDLHVDKYITKPIEFMQVLSVLDRSSEVIFQKRELQEKSLILKNKEKILSMGELIENIAHHWRQPLSIISTSSSSILVQKEYGMLTDELLIDSCQTINDTTQELSKTIDNFRTYFKTNTQKEKFSLIDIVNECCYILKYSLEEKNIKIVQDIDTNINVIERKQDLRQVFLSILANAKDILSSSDIDDKLIFIDIKKENDNISIIVKDNGGGIKEENISKVFEPYFTTKFNSKGTGLGLFMAYEILKNSLNSEIVVDNIEYNYNENRYKGAMFKIII